MDSGKEEAGNFQTIWDKYQIQNYISGSHLAPTFLLTLLPSSICLIQKFYFFPFPCAVSFEMCAHNE
jgi:hypothetical protein